MVKNRDTYSEELGFTGDSSSGRFLNRNFRFKNRNVEELFGEFSLRFGWFREEEDGNFGFSV